LKVVLGSPTRPGLWSEIENLGAGEAVTAPVKAAENADEKADTSHPP
jgi:hypothetical protein